MPRYFSWMSSLAGQIFALAVAPLVAHALVQALGERLGQAIGERFGHDRVVVVVLGSEARRTVPSARCRS